MRNLAFTVAYDGSNYYGFQRQNKVPTVQAKLEAAFNQLVNQPVTIIAASRTDAGVHARGQVINCKLETKIPTDNFPRALNWELPDDIVIKRAQEVVSDFDPRYWPRQKTYSYQLYCSDDFSPFFRNYAYHISYPLDLAAMREASKHLIGQYDFSSFRASGCVFDSPVREILEIEIIDIKENLVSILVTGTSFLYNMIRIIVGTLIKVGKKEFSPTKIKRILAAKDRKKAGPTAPAHGLCLEQIKYKDKIDN